MKRMLDLKVGRIEKAEFTPSNTYYFRISDHKLQTVVYSLKSTI